MSTISKVAERAGVSRTTVSHVINHADRVSKPLRERVQRAIDELGYVPNRQAQSLRTGRTNLVAMLIPDILNSFYTALVKTAQMELEAAGIDMLIINTDVPSGNSQKLGQEYLRQIRSKGVDGMIVGDFALHGLHDELTRIDFPAVFIGDLPNRAVDSVEVDDFGGCYAMGAHLAKKGHRRVAHVTGPAFFKEAMSRAAGFEQGLGDSGAPPIASLRYEGTYLPPAGQEAARWILDMPREERPSAVFFASYLMTSAALAEFYDRGLRVPDDIAVATFDDLPHLQYVRPRLTRAGTNPAELASRAAQMLLERLGGKYDGPPRREIVPHKLIIEDTA
ncbi:MAG TPA: LacI family DNA-binding transcriptional regulator [Devosiaceae bacterium]|nr:LacI family DNA-binding transcriptional regulator [Devosiaceae bacterium]